MKKNSLLRAYKKHGFTLVELSIVLVIIGLLIGGILVGQSLIESARINKVITFLSHNGIVVSQFQTKFKGLPGDSSKIVGPVSAYNGDDNGIIDSPGGISEATTFFQDLYTAGIIKEAYKPLNHYQDFAGYSVPAVPLNDTKTALRTSIANTDQDTVPALKVTYGKGDTVWGGSSTGVTDNYFLIELSGALIKNSQGVMHAKTALAIDSKIDDGIANGGAVLGINPFWTPNVDTVQPCRLSSQPQKYALTYPSDGCALTIRICRTQGTC